MTFDLKTFGDGALRVRFLQLPAKLQKSLQRTMLEVTKYLVTYIRDNKLQGQILKRKTGTLEGAVDSSVITTLNGVIGEVFVSKEAQKYAVVHERGGTFTIREHLRTSVLGNSYLVKAHTATFPRRSFLESSLLENNTYIAEQIDKAVFDAIQS